MALLYNMLPFVVVKQSLHSWFYVLVFVLWDVFLRGSVAITKVAAMLPLFWRNCLRSVVSREPARQGLCKYVRRVLDHFWEVINEDSTEQWFCVNYSVIISFYACVGTWESWRCLCCACMGMEVDSCFCWGSLWWLGVLEPFLLACFFTISKFFKP